jgi:toxin HigB-1
LPAIDEIKSRRIWQRKREEKEKWHTNKDELISDNGAIGQRMKARRGRTCGPGLAGAQRLSYQVKVFEGKRADYHQWEQEIVTCRADNKCKQAFFAEVTYCLMIVTSEITLNNMIKSFNHKGLKTFFETGSTKGIPSNQAKKIRVRLEVIDSATVIEEIDIPGWDLHQLTGNRAGTWSIRVTGNYRITFKFIDDNAYEVDYEDYH